MINKWVLREQPSVQEIEKLSKDFGVDKLFTLLLVQRKVTGKADAQTFFQKDLNGLYDPFLMKDMNKAVLRLEEAFAKSEGIMVFGDYDVDGTTSVAMMYSFLRYFHHKLMYYIPDRYTEGYGLSQKGIDTARQKGMSLIICLDCGIRSVELTDYAKEQGIDIIICDHHESGKTLPKAAAVLDPKRKDCNYPFDGLSGCGVGFKLLEAFAFKNHIPKHFVHAFLDFLAISIACDIVPVVDENRILLEHGLRSLNDNQRLSLSVFKKNMGFQRDMNTTNLVFGFGPRINAAGRMQHAHKALECMLHTKEEHILSTFHILEEHNNQRKKREQEMTLEAIDMLDQNKKSTVLFKPDWHKGIVGIVASRCIEHCYRPTIILTESKGDITGSARSISGFNIHDAIHECSDLLLQFGGHKQAAGLTMPKENLHSFINRFEEVVIERTKEEDFIPKINVSTEISFDQINLETYNMLESFAPFGPHNMKPVFVSKDIEILDYIILKEKYLKTRCKQKAYQKEFSTISFTLRDIAYYQSMLNEANLFDICYTIELNEFQNIKQLQLNIKDIRASKN